MFNYQNNTTLTRDEKWAISHYRDMGATPINWNYKPTLLELGKVKPDCFMANGYRRETLDENRLSNRDVEMLEKLCSNVQSAIIKNSINKSINLMRGLSDPLWLIDNYYEGDSFLDKGFTSFSTDPKVAYKYGVIYRKNNGKFAVFLDITLHPHDYALYIDDKESEFLLPYDSTYKINEIVPVDMEGGCTALHYYISKEN